MVCPAHSIWPYLHPHWQGHHPHIILILLLIIILLIIIILLLLIIIILFCSLPSSSFIILSPFSLSLLRLASWDAACLCIFPRFLHGLLPVPGRSTFMPLLRPTLSMSTCSSCFSSVPTASSACTLTAMPLVTIPTNIMWLNTVSSHKLSLHFHRPGRRPHHLHFHLHLHSVYQLLHKHSFTTTTFCTKKTLHKLAFTQTNLYTNSRLHASHHFLH